MEGEEQENAFDDIDWNGFKLLKPSPSPSTDAICKEDVPMIVPEATDAASRIAAFRARRLSGEPLRVSPPQQLVNTTPTTTPTTTGNDHNNDTDIEHDNHDGDSRNADPCKHASSLLPNIREQVTVSL